MARPGDLIVLPKVPRSRLEKFISQLGREGIRTVYADPKLVPPRSGMGTVHTSGGADYVVLGRPGGAKVKRIRGRKAGMRFRVLSNDDIEGILGAVRRHGLDFVIVEVRDWKIIPLENIIAKLHGANTMIFAAAGSPGEVRKMFSILEVGVDGVIFAASSVGEVREALVYMGTKSFKMAAAKITEIREVGDGERVCVDTASMLRAGEGMLVGSRSNFLFLVHNESVGSSFTSPRPFRVNAGAVHCYTLSPDGTTRYLSEIEAGGEVLVLDPKGAARRAAVGRSKIERRPMLMIKAKAGGETGGIIAQDAETIRLVGADGRPVSVTHLKKGDAVLVHSKPATGRHFGMEVSGEYILER